MGYNVKTIDSHVTIPKDRVLEAGKAAADLIDEDHDRNWEVTPGTLVEAAREAYFEGAEIDDNGDFRLNWYNDKTISEEVFLDTIAPYVTDESYITWIGEDDEMWADVFMGGVRYMLPVYIRVLADPEKYLPEHRENVRKIAVWADRMGIGNAPVEEA